LEKIKGEEPWRNLRLFIFIIEWRILMRRIRIKCHYCGEYGSFISEERVEVIPEVNLTMTDMNSLNAIAGVLAADGHFEMADILHHIQSETTKIVKYQEYKGEI